MGRGEGSAGRPGGGGGGGAEKIAGRWWRGRREKSVVAPKGRMGVGRGPNEGGVPHRHILKACDDSLRRLQTDYIDLYQPHSPDTDTPAEETLRALEDLVRMGKVRYLGCSNFPAWQLALALGITDPRGWARFDRCQPP